MFLQIGFLLNVLYIIALAIPLSDTVQQILSRQMKCLLKVYENGNGSS